MCAQREHRSFELEALPGRVIFGAGRVAEVPGEVRRLGGRRAVVIAARDREAVAARVEGGLGEAFAGRIDRIRRHVPEPVAEAAREQATELDADLLVALGGASTIGLAKAVALTHDLPIVAVPTTYAGSEMTPVWAITAGARRKTGRDLKVLPKVVVYDPALTATLSPAVSAASGMHALAHCVEALCVPSASPPTSAAALEGVRVLARALPAVVQAPDDLDARTDMLLGAYLAAGALAAVGTGLHHKVANVLGDTFDLPHAEVHATLLPYTTAYHAPGHPDAVLRVADALGADDAAGAVWDLGRAVGMPAALGDLGLTEEQADVAARIVAASGAATEQDARELLTRALEGERP